MTKLCSFSNENCTTAILTSSKKKRLAQTPTTQPPPKTLQLGAWGFAVLQKDLKPSGYASIASPKGYHRHRGVVHLLLQISDDRSVICKGLGRGAVTYSRRMSQKDAGKTQQTHGGVVVKNKNQTFPALLDPKVISFTAIPGIQVGNFMVAVVNARNEPY